MSRIDIAVITIREDENTAVLKRIPHYRALPCSNRTYAVGELENKQCGRVSIASIRHPGQGQMAAQETARNIIEDLDPSWIAVVGISSAQRRSRSLAGWEFWCLRAGPTA